MIPHPTTSKPTRIALWTMQALLAALFLFTGGMKLVMPIAALTREVPMPGLFLSSSGCSRWWGDWGWCYRVCCTCAPR